MLNNEHNHFPVMLKEVIDLLNIKENGHYLDGTFGGGGYSSAILEKALCQLDAIDRDPDAVLRGHSLSEKYNNFKIHYGSFGNIDNIFLKSQKFDGIVLDLGVSSFQLDQAKRGFSFRFDGPLDMRMDFNQDETAKDLIDKLSEKELADILYQYGDERFSKRIAKAIVTERNLTTITTTKQLAEIIKRAVPYNKHSKIHPATRSFQALRIIVNKELEEIEKFLTIAPSLLKTGGRLIVISFHSLEDRIIKKYMNQYAGNIAHPSRYLPQPHTINPMPSYKLLSKKPILPSPDEIKINPRSRSARLRVLEKMVNGDLPS